MKFHYFIFVCFSVVSLLYLSCNRKSRYTNINIFIFYLSFFFDAFCDVGFFSALGYGREKELLLFLQSTRRRKENIFLFVFNFIIFYVFFHFNNVIFDYNRHVCYLTSTLTYFCAIVVLISSRYCNMEDMFNFQPNFMFVLRIIYYS